MTHREPYLSVYVILFGIFCFSFGYNIYLYTKLQTLENTIHFSCCGTNEYEFKKIQDEIKRLENNNLFIHVGEPKSVLKNTGE